MVSDIFDGLSGIYAVKWQEGGQFSLDTCTNFLVARWKVLAFIAVVGFAHPWCKIEYLIRPSLGLCPLHMEAIFTITLVFDNRVTNPAPSCDTPAVGQICKDCYLRWRVRDTPLDVLDIILHICMSLRIIKWRSRELSLSWLVTRFHAPFYIGLHLIQHNAIYLLKGACDGHKSGGRNPRWNDAWAQKLHTIAKAAISASEHCHPREIIQAFMYRKILHGYNCTQIRPRKSDAQCSNQAGSTRRKASSLGEDYLIMLALRYM